ncbi:apolipoprotein A IV 2 [Triplophysa rosa]|uniref:Apolipoprotein A IV 2 n=1 Tax=Triplophysa rosa TaxID=992332 RepID=A0A9W7WPT9_TRIRA|nr:apolipoprotein A IV 2 [Triplophysa rosa]
MAYLSEKPPSDEDKSINCTSPQRVQTNSSSFIGLSTTETVGHKKTTVKMKLYLVLAFVAFTGCQANPLYADEPQSQLEKLTDRLLEELNTVKCALKPYIEYVTEPFEKGVDYIKNLDSETLKATLLQRSEELRGTLEERLKELQAQLEPFTQELKEKMNLYTRELKAFYEFYATGS